MVPYSEFRTGLSFAAVRAMLTHEQEVQKALGQYMFVRRSTVLGRWNELKRTMYDAYQRSDRERRRIIERAHRQSEAARAEGLPF